MEQTQTARLLAFRLAYVLFPHPLPVQSVQFRSPLPVTLFFRPDVHVSALVPSLLFKWRMGDDGERRRRE